jgi:transcriptional regulator of acetoin/glycerol metabolism
MSRPEIAVAWKRAWSIGLDPGMEVRERAPGDYDTRSRLMIAAEPVLDKMVDDLADTRFSVLLADRTSRIVDRRVKSETTARALDRVYAAPGFQYLEELSGTNSLATAYELRQPIAVTGDEHFLESLRRFCCYGAPIIHPVTRRLEGVIDVSGPVEDATTLLRPFLVRAVHDIEQRLLDGSRWVEKRLFAEFQAHATTKRHAVIVLGEDLVLTNTAAVDLLKGGDHAALRSIASDLPTHGSYESRLTLESGQEVLVSGRRVAGTDGGALFNLTDRTPPRPSSRTAFPVTSAALDADRATDVGVVLITGESGSGRTSTARRLAASPDAVCVDGADSVDDDKRWVRNVRAILQMDRAVIIDNVDLLDDLLADHLVSSLRHHTAPVFLTCRPVDEHLSNSHRALISLALVHHDLPPLRMRLTELGGLARAILADLLPSSSIELAPSAAQVLADYEWPGNLRELRSVLLYAARNRERGMIIDTDLPVTIRSASSRSRRLTVLEGVERDAIVNALREAGGNKAAAAARLGIGRTTLYARLRRYHITVA